MAKNEGNSNFLYENTTIKRNYRGSQRNGAELAKTVSVDD